MEGSVAHECTGGDQLVPDVDVSFVHVRVDVFAAHLSHGSCCLSVRPPDGEETLPFRPFCVGSLGGGGGSVSLRDSRTCRSLCRVPR